jgi:transposase-like protein
LTLQLYFNDVMSQAYDVTFRERAVAAYKAGEGGYHELARLFTIGYRTLQRWVALERASGSVAPRPDAGGWRCPIDMTVLEAVVRAAPDDTIAELCRTYNRRVPRAARTTRTSFGRAMRRAHFVRKKNARGRASGTARTSW